MGLLRLSHLCKHAATVILSLIYFRCLYIDGGPNDWSQISKQRKKEKEKKLKNTFIPLDGPCLLLQ